MKKPKRKKKRGLSGTGVKRTPADLIRILSKTSPKGDTANISRIFLGLTKGRCPSNRQRGHCANGPLVMGSVEGQRVLDEAANDAGIQGSTSYHARGAWEGKPDPTVVFESLHIGKDDPAPFRAKMNAMAREAGRRACQDAVMVVHQGKEHATVNFISHLGKRERRHC